jgi:hypothetical protein
MLETRFPACKHLIFRVRRGELGFPQRKKFFPNNGYLPTISLRDHAGIWAGALLLPHDRLSMFSNPYEMPVGFIELAEVALGICRDTNSPWPELIEIKHPDRIKKGQWYEYYWVMWKEWSEGVAYRKV